jgi:hypothetical protein
MAKLTVVNAARVTGVSRSQLYRYIKAGKLSRTPEGLIDTVELLRAGLMLHVPPVPPTVPETHDTTAPLVSSVPEPVSPVPSMDTATLERLIDVLQRELDAAREREKVLTQMMHDRETQLTQAAHERETLLLQLMAQMQHQNQRLLDVPRIPVPLQTAQDAPGATQPPTPPQDTSQRPTPPGDARGAMRQRILALLREHPAGLSTAELRDLLGVERSLADTCLGMRKYGLIQRVGRGKYVAVAASDTDRREGGHA